FLRKAWQGVGGLRRDLQYCMDWDLLLRISNIYPAVLINEFLAVSREYASTKTSSGALGRAYEIIRMVQSHSQVELTAGGLYYLLETLLGITRCPELESTREHCYRAMLTLQPEFARQCGNWDAFPEVGDSQDCCYLPVSTDLGGASLPVLNHHSKFDSSINQR